LDLAVKHDKRIMLAIKNGLDFQNFRQHAHNVVEFNDLEHFYAILSQHNFSPIVI
jgi:hypothetical protein